MKKTEINKREIYTEYTPEEWHALRAQDITSTDAAALFGISPYMTPYEMWHRKKDASVLQIEPNERMKWGTRLQDAIAKGIALDNGWTVTPMTEYARDPFMKMGASFDYQITFADDKKAILEIKNVDALAFKDGWILDGNNVEAPAHIELQVQHQLHVAGPEYQATYIGALIGGNRVVLIERDRDEIVIGKLLSRATAFWKSIRENREPKPDFSKDAEFISKLYRYSEAGKVIAADERMKILALQYKAAKHTEKIYETEAQACKAELMTLIGNAEKVMGDRFTISAGMIGPQHIEYDRDGYRDFRITVKKSKEAANA